MKLKRNPITKAVHNALFAGLVTSSVFGSVVLAQQDTEDEEVEDQQKITVTGSRIKRSDVEGALPITVITREQLELSGESNAADFIRNTTFNSAGSYRPQSGSGNAGVASVSLRGLGTARTLVLIDGRRMAKSGITGRSADLTQIPMGAIERIEVLSDGASAVYGSDAIGGVINVITRSDYEGAEIMLGGAEVSIPSEGGEREEGSIIFGASGDRASIVAGVSWNNREIIFARSLPWTNPGSSVFSNNYSTQSDVDGDGVLDDLTNWTAIPGACAFPGTGFGLTSTGRCGFNFNLVAADEASSGNESFYSRVKYEINDNWELWSNISVAKTSTFGRYAPAAATSAASFGGSGVLIPVDSPNNPTNPDSPLYDPNSGFEPQPVNWWHRFDALGNRDNTTETENTTFQVGVTGQIGRAEVEFGVNRNNNTFTNIGRGYLLRSAADAAIADGTYNLGDPYSVSETVLNSLNVTTSRVGRYDQDEIFGSVAFDLFEMTHGAAQISLGAEQRNEKYYDTYDSLSEAGQVGGSSGSSAGGTREVTSAFFEALFPLLDNLEMSLAGRYDKYSDYGNDFSPKLSFRYQMLDNLTLRASYGEGFRAPTLDELTQKPSQTADSVTFHLPTCQAFGYQDLATCRANQAQVSGTVISNPQLSSETSKQFAFGVAYEPTDWFNFTLDYFNIKIDNQIQAFSLQQIVNLAETGGQVPAGLNVDFNPDGSIRGGFLRGFANRGEFDTSGLDLNAKFSYDLFGGRMATGVQVSHLLSAENPNTRDFVGDPGLPATRAVINNTFSYGDFSIGYNLNLIGDQCDTMSADPNNPNGAICNGHVPTWVTHDLQLNYHTPWNGKITLGARNIGEKFPPLFLGNAGSRDYDFGLYDGYGRITYMRYTQTF